MILESNLRPLLAVRMYPVFYSALICFAFPISKLAIENSKVWEETRNFGNDL